MMLVLPLILLCIFAQSNTHCMPYNLVGWGNNEKGFIADGSLSVYDFPIMYNKSGTDLENKKIKSIAIGYDFTIFLTENNIVYELGKKRVDIESDFNVEFLKPSPVDLSNVKETFKSGYNITKVVATNSVGAMLVNGAVFTWGYSINGSLGRDCTFSFLPTKVNFPNDDIIIDIDAGSDHIIAVSNEGKIYEWGNLVWKNKISNIPELVIITSLASISSIPSIGAGHEHNHAQFNKNQLYIWGNIANNLYSTPTLMVSRCEIISKSSGFEQFLAATKCEDESTHIVCVGSNEYGGCGYSSNEVYTIESPLIYQYNLEYPIQHVLLNKYGTSLFISTEGHIFQFGKIVKYDERLATPKPTPYLLHQLNNINYLVGGYKSFTVICNNFNDIYHWGKDYGRFTGRTVYYSTPSLIQDQFDLHQLTISTSHITSIDKDGTVKAWGLFYPFLTPPAKPITLFENNTFIPGLISSGNEFTIFTDGENKNIYAYGRNDKGQLGLGDTVVRTDIHQIPISLSHNDEFIQLESGYAHTFALTKRYKLYVWGAGAEGQLGVGSVDYIANPVDISHLFRFKIVSVHIGSNHSIVRDNRGILYCFGKNTNNACCIPNQDYILEPTMIDIPYTGQIKQIKVGDEHNLFLIASGKLYGCGSNYYSQVSPEEDGMFQRINSGSLQDKKILNMWAFGKTSHARTDDGDIHIWGDSPYRYITFQDENQISLGSKLNDLKEPIKLKMKGDLVNSKIIDIFGNDACSIYYIEKLPTNIKCESGSTCYINGTIVLEENSVLNLTSSVLYLRGNLILKHGSIIKINGDIQQSKIRSVDEGCVQIIGGTLHYLLNFNDISDHAVIEGCHTGIFSEIKVMALNNSNFDCHNIKASQHFENGTLYVKFKSTSRCVEYVNSNGGFKWWIVVLSVIIIVATVIILALFIIYKKTNCNNIISQK